jgi:Holliday junction resolvasome RuvABC endonuclease subunit
MFLGLDQSYTSFGFCLLDHALHVVDFGTIKTSDVDGDHYDRCDKMSKQIVRYAATHSPIEIAIEGLAFGMRGDATRDLAGLLFVLMTNLRDQGFSPIVVPPLTLKKFATNSGKADKAQLIAALPPDVLETFKEKNFKKTTGLTDITDAYFLAKYALYINTTQLEG